jgi:hypothetical protein
VDVIILSRFYRPYSEKALPRVPLTPRIRGRYSSEAAPAFPVGYLSSGLDEFEPVGFASGHPKAPMAGTGWLDYGLPMRRCVVGGSMRQVTPTRLERSK